MVLFAATGVTRCCICRSDRRGSCKCRRSFVVASYAKPCVCVCGGGGLRHFHTYTTCRFSRVARPRRESLHRSGFSHEPGGIAAPVLLQNVTIKGRSQQHTWRQRDRETEGSKGEEIAQCIIAPSVITLCLYRGSCICAQPSCKT